MVGEVGAELLESGGIGCELADSRELFCGGRHRFRPPDNGQIVRRDCAELRGIQAWEYLAEGGWAGLLHFFPEIVGLERLNTARVDGIVVDNDLHCGAADGFVFGDWARSRAVQEESG